MTASSQLNVTNGSPNGSNFPQNVDTLSLAGKVAIITGSGKENGIGAAVTINYVSEKTAARAEKVAQEIRDLGARVVVVRGSIETQEGANHIVSETLKAFGSDHIDILVNNAGTGAVSELLDATPEQLQNEFGVMVFGMTQAAVKLGKIPSGGRIICLNQL